MAIVLADGEFVTLDESLGLQTGGVPVGPEDNNDEDIALASLNADFSNRLFGDLELNLLDSFAAANGVAANDFISLTETSVLTGFVKSNGDPLVAYDSTVPTDPTLGVLAGFTTVDGEAIYLFADVATGLGNFMFLGVDASGDIVLAGHLQADGTISTVQFEAITNPNSGNPDDAVDLSGLLDVAASGTLDFDLDDLPSGNNLFATLGESPTSPAIVIFGADVILKDDGSSDPQGDVMFFSQAGPNATIGMNNQMFNPGDAAFFVYVNNVNADFLSAWPDGLSSTEANDADNALYTGPTLNVTSAKFTIAQIQGNSLGAIQLTTYLGAADTGADLLEGPIDGATSPNIIAVKVTIGGTTYTFGSDSDAPVGLVDVSGLGTPTVTILGVDDAYAIEFITDTVHNRVKIAAVEATGVDGETLDGKFDIGGFVITQGVTTHEPVGDRIVFEDDGPAVGDGEGTAALTVDDSDFTTDDSASYAGLFDVNFGTDGGKDADNGGTVDVDAVTYALGVTGGPDAVSGLTDTLTGEAVVLNLDGTVVVGTTALGGLEVFRVSVDVNTGEVTLNQSRAVVHDDMADHEEDGVGEPSKLTSADLITLTATATDDDGDADDHTVDIGDTFFFEDDGPTNALSDEAPPDLITDDTDIDIPSSDSADFSGLFDPDFGNDEEGDPAASYALGVSGPDADSGLIDTLTGEAVLLNLDGGGDVVGTSATGGEVLRISVDAGGTVTLTQTRAVEHDNPDDAQEDGAGEPSMFSVATLVTLTQTAYDGDGDHDDATANIGLAFKFLDDGPTMDLSTADMPQVITDDTDIPDTSDAVDFSVLFDPDFGEDGEGDPTTYALDVNGTDVNSGLVETLSGEAVVLNLVSGEVVGTTEFGGAEVLRISVDADGKVTLVQKLAVEHNDPSDHDENTSPAKFVGTNLISLVATAYDGDGDSDDEEADITSAFNFEDDGPSISPIGTVPDLVVDDTDFATDAMLSFAGLFDPDFGKDGAKDDDNNGADVDAVTYSLGLHPTEDDSGLVDSLSGQAVLLSLDGDDVVGKTATSGLEVFRITVDDETGEVTLNQSRAVKHDNAGDPVESGLSAATLSAANLVTLIATAEDGDGDTAPLTRDIGLAFHFEDDGPALGPIASDTIIFDDASADVSHLLGAVTGNDGADVSITDFTPSVDFGFATLIGVQEDAKTVIYYEDEDGNGVIDPLVEDNAFFKLSLDTTNGDPANWNYVFEALADPAPTTIPFDFDDLPSGANLFGVVGESATDPAIIVFGKNVSLNTATGKYDNASDVIKTSQGGTGATIGVDSQMFDPGDGAFFVYVDDPVANYLSGVPGGLNSTEADDADNVQYTGGTVDVHTASLSISQTQGNELASMRLTTWLGDADTGRDLVLDADTGTQPNIVEVRVILADGTTVLTFDANEVLSGVEVSGLGTTSVVVSGLDDGYTIEWDTDDLHNRVLVEGLVGKFDVGKFSIGEVGVTPDAELSFEVTIEDFDINGDTAVADFTIGIDGNGDGIIDVV